MAKKELKLHAVVSPTETVVVSAYDDTGKAEACTLAFYMVSSHVPPCVTIAINATQRRKTLAAMLQSKAFVLGFPSEEQVREADYLGVESGYNTDKLANIGFTASVAKTVNAPVINEMLLSLECEIVHTVTVGSHMQVTGEVKRILADESVLNEKDRIDINKLKPIIYDEEQVQYLSVGDKISDAFRIGLEMKKEFDVKSEMAIEALQELSKAAESNGTSEMTLDEINAEINEVRRK